MKIKSHIAWVVESKGILVIDQSCSQSLFLDFPEAAVWAILIHNGLSPKSLSVLSAVLNKNENDTRKIIECSLNEWKSRGLINP